jgi:hypothetical protein
MSSLINNPAYFYQFTFSKPDNLIISDQNIQNFSHLWPFSVANSYIQPSLASHFLHVTSRTMCLPVSIIRSWVSLKNQRNHNMDIILRQGHLKIWTEHWHNWPCLCWEDSKHFNICSAVVKLKSIQSTLYYVLFRALYIHKKPKSIICQKIALVWVLSLEQSSCNLNNTFEPSALIRKIWVWNL